MVSKAKYEDQYTKGKMGKRLDDCKERYHKATRKLHSTHNEYGVVHQIVSPILNSESTNFCNEYIYYGDLFQLVNWRKKLFGTNKKFVSFLTCSWHQKKRNQEFTNSRI